MYLYLLKMKTLSKFQNIIFIIGAILLLFGAATFPVWGEMSFYVYTVGAFCFGAMQMYAGYDGANWIIRRLRRQQILGTWCLMLVSVAMAMKVFHFGFAQRNEWLVFLTIGCVFEIYTAFRIPSELEKEQKK